MKKLTPIFIILALLCLVSCSTLGSVNSLTGIWKSTDEDFTYTYMFTAEGHYSYESTSSNGLEYAWFGTYEYDDLKIYTDSGDFNYILDGSFLLIDDMAYTRTSRIAKYSSSPLRLLGTWSNEKNNIGFTSDYTVVMGTALGLTDYVLDGDFVTVNGKDYEVGVFNAKLFIKNAEGFYSKEWGTQVFTRISSVGKDNTSKQILLNVGTWTLVELQGTTTSVYTFYQNGNYTVQQYSNNSSTSKNYAGVFELNGNRIQLSNNADLDFAIIDNTPFMFTH